MHVEMTIQAIPAYTNHIHQICLNGVAGNKVYCIAL